MYEYLEIYVCCWGDGRVRDGGIGMVEQLGREVWYIWYYVARKKHEVAQSNIVYTI